MLAVQRRRSGGPLRIVLVALVMLLIGLVLLARRPRPDRMPAIAAEAPIRPRPTTTSLVDPAPVPDEVEVQASTPEPVADEPWLEFHDAVDDMLRWLDEERARGEEPGR